MAEHVKQSNLKRTLSNTSNSTRQFFNDILKRTNSVFDRGKHKCRTNESSTSSGGDVESLNDSISSSTCNSFRSLSVSGHHHHSNTTEMARPNLGLILDDEISVPPTSSTVQTENLLHFDSDMLTRTSESNIVNNNNYISRSLCESKPTTICGSYSGSSLNKLSHTFSERISPSHSAALSNASSVIESSRFATPSNSSDPALPPRPPRLNSPLHPSNVDFNSPLRQHTLQEQQANSFSRNASPKTAMTLSNSKQPKILPIVNDKGDQVSYTHYWLVSPDETNADLSNISPASTKRQRTRSKSDCFVTIEESLTVPVSCNAPKSTTKFQKSLDCLHTAKSKDVSLHINTCNIPANDGAQINAGSSACAQTSTPAAIELFQSMSPRDNICQVMIAVHGATEEEAYTSLGQCGWDVAAAICFLKVEQLFRLGLTSRNNCRSILKRHNWNLETAASCLVDVLGNAHAHSNACRMDKYKLHQQS